MSNAPRALLRMDRSRYYSTVHGEREQQDPHARAVYMQDGLSFDGEGFLIAELVPENKKAAVEARLKKLSHAEKKHASPATAADDGDFGPTGQDSQQPGETAGGVNLESWLRGEERYPWFQVAGAIRARFNRNVNNQTDAVIFLAQEGLVPPDQMAENFQKLLG